MENRKESLKEQKTSYMEIAKKNKQESLKEHIASYMENRKKNKQEELEEKEELSIEEIEQRVKESAEDIQNLEELLEIPVLVGNVKHSLVDGVNCRILPIPLLNIALISNIGLEIVDIDLRAEMESALELELTVISEDAIYKFTLYDLYCVGLVVVVDSITEEVELSPIEFRGITTKMNKEEITSLCKK